MMKKNLLLILMCFVCGLVYAHDGLNFRNLDVKSGISDNYVRSVLRDRYGFMWFATLNGLNRYDGYQFIISTIGNKINWRTRYSLF